MKNFALTLLLSTLAASTAGATTITCQRLSCEPFQPNGGNGAQALCDTFTGPVKFTLSKNNDDVTRQPVQIAEGQFDGEFYEFNGYYLEDMSGGINIRGNEKHKSFQAYVSPQKDRGLIVHTGGLVIIQAKLELSCREEK